MRTVVEIISAGIDMVGACNRPDTYIRIGPSETTHSFFVLLPITLNIVDIFLTAIAECFSRNTVFQAMHVQNMRNGPLIILRLQNEIFSPNILVICLESEADVLLIREVFVALGEGS